MNTIEMFTQLDAQAYHNWKRHVDIWLKRKCGETSDGLPDFDYRECFNDNVSPQITANRAIKHAKKYF